MKTNSIKLITLVSKKIMLQKKIFKYNEMITDIDELINEDINNKSNLEDFELIFKKLITDFKDILLDEDEESNDKMEIIKIV
jgi:hypothetical protein